MGDGRNVLFMAGLGLRVLGIDISAEAVEKRRRRAREFGHLWRPARRKGA